VVQAEEARAMLRAEFFGGAADPQRVREILTEARGHLELQLSLVHRRQAELATLESELRERHDRVLERLAEAGER
jgi:hypothetical protein